MLPTHMHLRARIEARSTIPSAIAATIALGVLTLACPAAAQSATDATSPPAKAEPVGVSQSTPAPEPASEPAAGRGGRVFGSKGQLTASVWRLYGASFDFQHVDLGGGQSQTQTTFTLSLLGTDAPKPYFIPRLGGDWFVTEHVSIGASGMFVLSSPEGSPSSTFFVANPRVGYADTFNDLFSFWVTAGVTYSRWQTSDPVQSPTSPTITWVDHVESGLAASIDAMLVVHPVGNFGFTVGPAADIAFAGNSDVTKTWRSVGLMGGLVAWL